MKLLITGIPGAGKTTIGEYLRSEKGYQHLDMENLPGSSHEEWNNAIGQFLARPGEDKVITWGFVPGASNSLVNHFQQCGFKMIWFDGNRAAARQAFLNRGDVSEALLNMQMDRIDVMDLAVFKPLIVDTFESNGKHLAKETIINRIFALCC